MRSQLRPLVLLVLTLTILTACGNKPVQLELPTDTPTTSEPTAPTDN